MRNLLETLQSAGTVGTAQPTAPSARPHGISSEPLQTSEPDPRVSFASRRLAAAVGGVQLLAGDIGLMRCERPLPGRAFQRPL